MVIPDNFEAGGRDGEAGGGSKTDEPAYDAVLDKNEKRVSDKTDVFLSCTTDPGLSIQNLSSSKLAGSNPNDSK